MKAYILGSKTQTKSPQVKLCYILVIYCQYYLTIKSQCINNLHHVSIKFIKDTYNITSLK